MSKLPGFHLARRELQEPREERDALAVPAVQGEPVAYISHTSEGDILGWERQFDAPSHTPLYATPQPAPDVARLVEALEDIAGTHHHSASAGEYFAKVARAALAKARGE